MQELLLDAELEVVAGGGHLVLPLAELPWVEWLEQLARRAGFTASSTEMATAKGH